MGMGYGAAQAKQTAVLRPSSNRVRKAKKVKQTWKQRFKNWLLHDKSDAMEALSLDESPNLSGDGMRFQLFRATGGYVIETRQYDSKTDRSSYKLYIVKDDEDVGQAFGKIITMESLR
jgi:hypothetical protein